MITPKVFLDIDSFGPAAARRINASTAKPLSRSQCASVEKDQVLS